MNDYYDILCVSKTATPAEIKAGYRRMASMWHPDKMANSKDARKAPGMMQKINEAYETLSSPVKRKAYDDAGGDAEVVVNCNRVLRQLIQQAIASPMIPEDLLGYIRSQVSDQVQVGQQNLRQHKQYAAALAARVDKVRLEDGGDNLFQQVLQERIAAVDETIRSTEKTLASFEMAAKVLAEYKSDQVRDLGVHSHVPQWTFAPPYRTGGF